MGKIQIAEKVITCAAGTLGHGNVVRKAEQGIGDVVSNCRQWKNVCGVDSILQIKPNNIPTALKGLRLAPGTREVVQYTLKNGKKVRVFNILPEDLSTIKRILEHKEEYFDFHHMDARTVNDNRYITEKCFKIVKEIQEMGIKDPDTHIRIAEAEGKICAITIGGLPKRTPNGDIIHSCRKAATQSETELNWTAAWPQHNGYGTCSINETLREMIKRFKKVIIQSEIKEKSHASDCYRNMGFKENYKNNPNRRVFDIEYHKDILPCLNTDDPAEMYNYLIRVMRGYPKTLQEHISKFDQDNMREVFIKQVDLSKLVPELDRFA